jgi:hypothetical protein
MEIFVAVVEAGSLTAAAERFDISSAMVGKQTFRRVTQADSKPIADNARRVIIRLRDVAYT